MGVPYPRIITSSIFKVVQHTKVIYESKETTTNMYL